MHQLVFKKDPVLSLFHFTNCQAQTCYTGEACCRPCVLFFCLCCFSSSGTDSSAVLTSLGVDTASIEWTAQPFWIVVKLPVFCLSFVTLRSTHQRYVGKWRRESVAVLHWESYLCTTYLPSVHLLVCMHACSYGTPELTDWSGIEFVVWK